MSYSERPSVLLHAMNNELKDEIEDIEYQYDPEKFNALQPDPKFVNKGQKDWNAQRAKWARAVTSKPAPERDDYSYDIEQIINRIAAYRPFSSDVPLPLLAEILEVVWVEHPTL